MYGGGHNGVERAVPPPSPSGFEVVVLAASHGGIRACSEVLSRLPSDFPAAVVVAQHLPPGIEEQFRAGLEARSKLPVRHAVAGAALAAGTAYVAPPVDQLLVGPDGAFTVLPGVRPARCLADPLFESVAAVFGPRAIGGVLTGRLKDGSRGVQALKGAGGRVLVQLPSTAAAPDMPSAALATGCCDFALPPEKIGDALTALVMAPGAAEVLRVPVPAWAAGTTLD